MMQYEIMDKTTGKIWVVAGYSYIEALKHNGLYKDVGNFVLLYSYWVED